MYLVSSGIYVGKCLDGRLLRNYLSLLYKIGIYRKPNEYIGIYMYLGSRSFFDQVHSEWNWISGERYRSIGPLVCLVTCKPDRKFFLQKSRFPNARFCQRLLMLVWAGFEMRWTKWTFVPWYFHYSIWYKWRNCWNIFYWNRFKIKKRMSKGYKKSHATQHCKQMYRKCVKCWNNVYPRKSSLTI